MSLFPPDEAIPQEHMLPARLDIRHYLLDGDLEPWAGEMQTAYSPLLRPTPAGLAKRPLGEFPSMGEKEALNALAAARKAWDQGRGHWPTLPVEERIAHLSGFARRMKEVRSEVIRLIMWEIAKTLPDATKEFDRTVAYIADTIDALKDLDRTSSRFVINEGVVGQIRRAPLGVALCMGPYNYPLNETFTTLIPALIMGNTVVFKPPKMGILLYAPLLGAFKEAFPPGVVNIVLGSGRNVAGPLMAHGGIDALAFIGSSRVAGGLKKLHPRPHHLRSVLGLEAKNPAIILPDADLELAVKECLLGSLSFNGQRCTAIKIIFAHERIAGEFTGRLSEAVDGLKAGMPWEEGVAVTPLPEDGKCKYLGELVEDAVDKGARVANRWGGDVEGTIFFPAVLSGVRQGMRVWEEEQFGPVVPVARFSDVEEPLNYISDSAYGQQVALFGTDPGEMAGLIDPLVNQVCRVNLNSQCQRGPDTFPFTGRKDSAEGTLSVSDALRVFSIRTLVAAKENPQNKELIDRIVRERQSKFLNTDFIL